MTEPRALDGADSSSSSEATSTPMTSRKDDTVPAAGPQDTELVDGGGEDSADTKRNEPDVADIEEEDPSSEESEGEGGEGEEDDLIEEDDYIYDEEVEPSPVNPHVLHRRHSTREPLSMGHECSKLDSGI